MFDGFYKDGRRNPKIRRNEKHRKYWNDIDDSGQISCICKKNYRGLNDGTCYFYEDGNINAVGEGNAHPVALSEAFRQAAINASSLALSII